MIARSHLIKRRREMAGAELRGKAIHAFMELQRAERTIAGAAEVLPRHKARWTFARGRFASLAAQLPDDKAMCGLWFQTV